MVTSETVLHLELQKVEFTIPIFTITDFLQYVKSFTIDISYI